MKMKYSELLDLLMRLEKKWSQSKCKAPDWVRNPDKFGGNVQFFALKERKDDPELPIVIEVGINYTQRKEEIPGLAVAEDLNNAPERRLLEHCNEHRDAWTKSCLVSPALPRPLMQKVVSKVDGFAVEDFHLVMTNFSPWITKESWQSELIESRSAGIGAYLLTNPPYNADPLEWPFPHLDDLKTHLEGHVDLWIGHGLKAVVPLFGLFVRRHRLQNWLMCGNTASGCSPCVVDGLVRFQRPKRL